MIDGFTISDGLSSGDADGTSECFNCFGGGIYIKNDQEEWFESRISLEVSNCFFTNNKAIQGASIFGYIYVDLDIFNCQFSDNKAINGKYHVSGGAGIYLTLQSTLTVDSSSFMFVHYYDFTFCLAIIIFYFPQILCTMLAHCFFFGLFCILHDCNATIPTQKQ